ncbi:3 beta-hydroxysteroid dehydrogenase/Delta 5--_4-isomerase [Posidoniimonas polymericola]|uniref:3 beta-hydroxysteroid dehydrogenase/Delta 5-->4-isomerase n=1 Tax=Posidoniimonas polymericola TaxID=2528002 RepID=A0A5C5YMS5_9BACT|nr:SDR family oxidoreductase [Posidoniimonas polymericola]TWT76117.1 3 beta-hydroxysteroid dehydrogenase/Delta 5-->4-isomerase [Posidoniimonas polymericola]
MHANERYDAPFAVTGATGYVGGRLAPALLERGQRVRCLVRSPRKIEQRTWRRAEKLEVVECDLMETDRVTEALRGCRVAYYLVHSMISAGDEYQQRDLKLARSFATAAERAGIEQIIYLGGLGEDSDDLSAHLQSRREVEQALASTSVPVTTLRAAMIIGAGSASFEILRYLVNRLPIMITPRWVDTECQPVAITDVLHWLIAAGESPEAVGKTLDIGGADSHTYRELMQITARQLGLGRRWIFGVPVLTPRLSSAWISLITPVTYRIARPLADGLSNRVVVGDRPAQAVLPHEPLTSEQAISAAVHAAEVNQVETHWSAAGPIPGDPDWAGGSVLRDERQIDIDAPASAVFDAVCRVGGGHGWYAGDILWKIRGWMDQLVGGPGLRRGRRHPENIQYGEALDFWRVVGIERGRLLRLRAEMKLPGDAQLEFRLEPTDAPARTRLFMAASFRPRGLFGLFYWYAVLPLHHFVFGGMLQGIKSSAESAAKATAADRPVPAGNAHSA